MTNQAEYQRILNRWRGEEGSLDSKGWISFPMWCNRKGISVNEFGQIMEDTRSKFRDIGRRGAQFGKKP